MPCFPLVEEETYSLAISRPIFAIGTRIKDVIRWIGLIEIMDDADSSYEMKQREKRATVQAIQLHERARAEAPAGIDTQVRIRRLFSFTQIFMFSLTYMGLWEGMCT